jgi:hypothetical protein
MMEIRPRFIEKDFRDYYEKSYQDLRADLEDKLNDRRPILIFLIAVTLVSCSLIVFDERWLNFGLIPCAALVVMVCWNGLLKYEVKTYINENRLNLDNYIAGPACTQQIKYVYNDIIIEYFEGEDLKHTFFWSDLDNVEYRDECFVLNFRVEKAYITMFRSMNNKDELKWFETEVVRNVKRLNDKSVSSPDNQH